MKTLIIYDGPSLIDGSPIIVLAQAGSRNSKTGDMVQTFILYVLVVLQNVLVVHTVNLVVLVALLM